MRLGEPKITTHFKLVTVVSSAVPAENSLKLDTFSKQSAKKTSGARHAFGSNSSDLSNSISRSRVGLRGPRALGHVFGKRFVVHRYG